MIAVYTTTVKYEITEKTKIAYKNFLSDFECTEEDCPFNEWLSSLIADSNGFIWEQEYGCEFIECNIDLKME